jgi:Uncharacterized conserved protein
VDKVHSYKLKAKPELGIQFGAGGDTPASGLEAIGTSDPSKLVNLGRKFLDAGVERLMIESEGITENVNSWRTDVVSKIMKELPSEGVMFEAADPKVFNWYIREFGIDVNLFVDHSQIVQLECLRSGIWGTADTLGKDCVLPTTVDSDVCIEHSKVELFISRESPSYTFLPRPASRPVLASMTAIGEII